MTNLQNIPPLFILGYPKSGTTLLLSLLDGHKDLLVLPEEMQLYDAIMPMRAGQERKEYILGKSKIARLAQGRIDGQSGERDYSFIKSEGLLERLEADINGQEKASDLFYKLFSIYSDLTKAKRARYLVEKTPKNEFHLEKIKTDFPNARFIYCVRDPRDNYFSYQKKRKVLSIKEFTFAWKKSVNVALSNNIPVFRYEDMIKNPEKELLRLCECIGVEYASSMLKPTRAGAQWGGNSMFGYKEYGIHLHALERRWEDLPKTEIQEIEKNLKAEMDRLGYEWIYKFSPNPIKNYIRRMLENKYFRAIDVSIVGYPKTGNTWFSALLRQLMVLHYHLPQDEMGRVLFSDFEPRTMFRAKRVLPKIYKTHALLSTSSPELNGMPEKLFYLRNKPMIILFRDFKDVLVSRYMHAAYREVPAQFEGTIEEFVKSSNFGVKKMVKYYNLLIQDRQKTEAPTMLLRYEDLWNDTESLLSQALDFTGIKNIEGGIVQKTIDLCSFENMQKAELKTHKEKAVVDGLYASENKDPRAMKVRKGGIGNWTECMPEDLGRYVDDICRAELDPYYLGAEKKEVA